MSTQRIAYDRRRALWEANDRKCVHCEEQIRWLYLEIDHLIPEYLAGKPELEGLLKSYALPLDFDLRSDRNLVPSCTVCNGKKREGILSITALLISDASKRAEKISQLVDRYQTDKKIDTALSVVSIAFEKGLLPQSAIQGLILPSDDPAAKGPSQPSAQSEWLRLFRNFSTDLLNWPQETGGEWIERPALGELEALLNTGRSTLAALLGEPGCGKSALLARLGTQLRDRDVQLLALKTDLLPKHIRTVSDIEEHLGMPSIVECVRTLAAEKPVVLLLDQVDAISEMMDLQTSRLSALLSLVQKLRGIDDVHIIVSCRDFEFKHDVRLSSLTPLHVRMTDPEWKAVNHILSNQGVNTAQWPHTTKELLRRPQHLTFFVQHLTHEPIPTYSSYHAMLQDVINARLLTHAWGPPAMRLMEELAGRMAQDEELWVPVAFYLDRYSIELRHLAAADLIRSSDDTLRIGFAHQTIFDFVRSRAFTSQIASLSQHVLERQDAVFVRPTLWSALHYMRKADPIGYAREFGILWNNPSLRPHLRYLLIEFLGRIEDPSLLEVSRVVGLLSDVPLRSKAFGAMAGRPAWFQSLRTHLPGLMSGDDTSAWHAAWLLRRAFDFAWEETLSLIETVWGANPARDRLTLHTLWENKHWDERSVGIVELISRRTPDHDLISHLRDSISAGRPDLAPRVVAAELWGCLAIIDNQPPPAEVTQDGSLAAAMRRRVKTPEWQVEEVLDSASRWHDLTKVANGAPGEFVRQVWPWIEHVANKFARKSDYRISYLHDRIVHLAGDESGRGSEFPAALSSALKGFALSEPENFVAFRDSHRDHSLLILHRMLLMGSCYLPTSQAEATFLWVKSDPRMFAIGPSNNVHRETCDALRAIGEHLSRESLHELEELVKTWRYFLRDPTASAEQRHARIRWTRQHRLRILRALPQRKVSLAIKRLIEEESRALPGTPDWDHQTGEAHFIGSPVTTEQMSRASDEDLLRLFEALPDRTGHSHPRDQDRGGAIQAAQAFGALAKQDARRVIALFPRLEPGCEERYAGEALRNIADAGPEHDAAILIAIRDFCGRGFVSDEFRAHVALTLQTIAGRNAGLEDDIIQLLESWLTDVPEGPPVERLDRDEDASLILEHGLEMVPQDNYTILRAVFMGYLCRVPDQPDHWLAVLERHLNRHEGLPVWSALASHELTHLAKADRARSIQFVEKLFEAQPLLLETRGAVRFLSWAHSWLPETIVHRCLTHWLKSDWRRGPQAAAEIAMLRHAFIPSDIFCGDLVQLLLKQPANDPLRIRLGLTHIAAHLWAHHDISRNRTTPVLLQLLPDCTEAIASHWPSVFNTRQIQPDDYTAQILEVLAANPSVLTGHHSTLFEHLAQLLRLGFPASRIASLLTAVVNNFGKEVGDLRTAWPASAREIIDLSLTLQRIPETRSEGLTIFEKLLEADAYRIGDTLTEIDRRPI